MNKKRDFACLSGTALKLIAMLSMVFDHVGDNFFPEQTWMRMVTHSEALIDEAVGIIAEVLHRHHIGE